MAHSPGPAERRAHLIREMARSSERSHSRGSASSIGSAREQIHYDTATQELPLPSEHEFQINSSALRRAFPDFSQYGSSEEDSIELGRGLKGSLKKQPIARSLPRSLPSADVSENLSFSFGGESRYEVTGTPPLKPRDKHLPSNNIKSTTRASSMKENVDPLGRATNVASIGSRADGRKVLVESLQPRVESDDSESDKRSAPTNAAVKNTRFDRRSRHTSNAKSDATGTININDIAKGSAKLEDAIHNGTVTGTHQSFLLPDLPNITELVSGVRQDGTPLFSRSAKAASRFGTPSQRRKPSTLKQSHLPINSVPIPIDEKSLYVSLQLLQDKVTALEADKANAEDKLEEYELEVLQLKSKLEQQARNRHSDSALGTDIEDGKRRDWEGQKTQLESSIRNLQDRLDRANRKLNTSEVAVTTLTNDRDAAHQQLAVAYLNSKELKNESTSMQREIADVKAEFAKVTRRHESRIHQLTDQEAELRGKIERREQAIREMGSLAKELWKTRNALAISNPTKDATSTQIGRTKDNTQPTGLFASIIPTSRMISTATRATERQRSQSRGRQAPQAVQTAPELEATTDLRSLVPPPAQQADLTIDSTYASFMDGDEVSKLRRIVEEDKALLARSSGGNADGETQHTFRDEITRITNHTQPLPRKSSMKTVSQKFSEDIERNIDLGLGRQGHHVREGARDDGEASVFANDTTRRSMSPERQDTQRSMMSQRSQRRARIDGNTQPDMTSAFILPDITLHGVAAITPSASTHATSGTKLTTIITRPTPVSDRMPITLPGHDDPTVRPAQAPGLALATVLRGLEDELHNLRTQLAEQENLYNQHDPSLSKRQRKVVYARIQKLLPMIDTRADQIYALYDVLEGQKDKGQMMQEEEVEITLQNIGIDQATARAVSGQTGRSTTMVNDSDAEIDEDDDELPWEGIETTQTQTLPSLRAMRVR